MGKALNGFGCLVPPRKPGGNWVARWMVGGKIKTKTTGETDEKKARKVLDRLTKPYRENSQRYIAEALRREADHIEDNLETSDKKLEFSELWQAFEEKLWDRSLAKSTRNTYQMAILYLRNWVEKRATKRRTFIPKVCHFFKNDAEEFLKSLSEERTAGTYNQYLSVYTRVWRVLGKEYGLNQKVWEGFRRKSKYETKSKRRLLSEDEITRIFKAVEDDSELKILFSLGLYTGQRLGDCCLWRWENVDIEKRTVSVIPVKTKKHHIEPITIPMMPGLEKVLTERGIKKEGYISDSNARYYLANTMWRRLNAVFKKSEIAVSERDEKERRRTVTGFHALRGHWVSLMAPLIGALATSKLVGHSSLAMTMEYEHIILDQVRERMENAFAGK